MNLKIAEEVVDDYENYDCAEAAETHLFGSVSCDKCFEESVHIFSVLNYINKDNSFILFEIDTP